MASETTQEAWTTKDGREIPLRDLELGHLLNIIAWLERRCPTYENHENTHDSWGSCLAYACSTTAEMASYAAEQEAERLFRLAILETNTARWLAVLRAELASRPLETK